MAPEADLVIAGLSSLYTTSIGSAIQNICNYADQVGKPCVISLSLGSQAGPHDGTGSIASIVDQYAGNNHIIVYAASNDGMRADYFVNIGTSNGGGMYASGTSTKSKPMMVNLQKSWSNATGNVQLYSASVYAYARTSNVPTALKLHVVDTSTGNIVYSTSEYTSSNTISVSSNSGLAKYFSGSSDSYISVTRSTTNNKYYWTISSPTLKSTSYSQNSSGVYESKYALCISVYPTGSNSSTIIDMWEGSRVNWFGNDLTLSSTYSNNYNVVGGNDECSVSDNACYSKVISVGAYVTRNSVTNYEGTVTDASDDYPNIGDHAYFSSWQSLGYGPLGTALPHINAPGARIIAGVNHYHTASVDDYSYYSDNYKTDLVVNSTSYPYGAMEGTSMATPCVSGIIALWLQACVEAGKTPSPDYIKEVMQNTWDNDQWTNGAGHGAKTFGTHGKINAIKGIQYILGTSAGPLLTVSPTTLNFGEAYVGDVSPTKTFNVKGVNLTGNVTLSLNDPDGVFSLSETSITKSNATSGRDITVTFTPKGNATYTGKVTISSTDAEPVTVTLNATGKIYTPTIAASPTSLSFTGNSGSTYTKTVTVISSHLQGDVTAAIQNDANGFYSVSPASFNAASQTVTVTWAPTAGGTSTANLVLTTTGTGANTVTVPITGTAQGPTIAANPTSVTFSGYATQTYTQTVTVTGTNLSQNITASLTGANVYSIDKTSLSKTGGTITVTYAPTDAGNTSATLTLSSNGASTVTVPITGTAQAATPTLMVTPTSLTFSPDVNTPESKTFAVTGRFINEDVTITLNDPSGVFALGQATIPAASISETDAVNVTVTFNAEDEGDYTGSVTVSSNGATSQTISLSASISTGGTASDAYLNIAKYATIDEAGATVSGMSKIYSYTEYPSNACAWLTLSYYGAQKVDANQKWYDFEGTAKSGNETWNANGIFLGSSNYFNGTAYYCNWNEAWQNFYVTNCSEVSQLSYNIQSSYNSGNVYPVKMQIYECTLKADGTLSVGNTAVVNKQSQTTNQAEVLSSGTLDPSKIYKVRIYNDYSRLYEIGFQTPLTTTEATLATIERKGVIGTTYTISDELVAVYADGDKGLLWCKDQGNASINPSTILDGQIDFMRNEALTGDTGQGSREWDQSNWVVLKFPTADQTNGIDDMLNEAANKNMKIKAGTVTGRYIDNRNYTIEVQPANGKYTLTYNGSLEYIPNVYCVANFLESNLNIDGNTGAVGVHGDRYFFMNPKIQEVCEITYAMWDIDMFVTPNNTEILGAINVDWSLNSTGGAKPSLLDGQTYRFKTIVAHPTSTRTNGLKGGGTPSDNFVVYPANLTGNDNIVTAINGIYTDVNREVVGVEYVNVAGMISDKPFQGVNIVVTRYSDGSKTTSKKVFK